MNQFLTSQPIRFAHCTPKVADKRFWWLLTAFGTFWAPQGVGHQDHQPLMRSWVDQDQKVIKHQFNHLTQTITIIQHLFDKQLCSTWLPILFYNKKLLNLYTTTTCRTSYCYRHTTCSTLILFFESQLSRVVNKGLFRQHTAIWGRRALGLGWLPLVRLIADLTPVDLESSVVVVEHTYN